MNLSEDPVGRDHSVGANQARIAPPTQNIAIVHEWLTNRAGSERCVEALLSAFPHHTLYTSVLAPSVFPEVATAAEVALRWRALARENGHLRAGPLLPLAMRSMRVDPSHDLAVFSFHHFATWVRLPPEMPAIVYCHTPPRFIYRPDGTTGERNMAMRLAHRTRRVARFMDQRQMRRLAPRLVVNSTAVEARVHAFYGLESRVVQPPVDVEEHRAVLKTDPPDDYFLFVGRLVPYKRADVVIEAFGRLRRRLIVVGDGRMRATLQRSAPLNVEFRGRVSDDELKTLYAGARGLVFPNEEDFGIIPAEAMATGCPVVALNRGGIRDFLVPGTNGVFIEEESAPALMSGVRALLSETWDRSQVSESVMWLSTSRFQTAFKEVASEALHESRLATC